MSKSADAFRTISEVAEWLGVQTHVLRFWESKFSQVKPVKRAGGRRYYRPVDMLLLGGIRKLLHDDGLTIKGVQKVLREKGIAHVSSMSHGLDEVSAAPPPSPAPRTPAPQSIPEPDSDKMDAKADTTNTIRKFAPGMQTYGEAKTEDDLQRPSFTEDAVVMPAGEEAADAPADAAMPPVAPSDARSEELADTDLAPPEDAPQTRPEPEITQTAEVASDPEPDATPGPETEPETAEPPVVKKVVKKDDAEIAGHLSDASDAPRPPDPVPESGPVTSEPEPAPGPEPEPEPATGREPVVTAISTDDAGDTAAPDHPPASQDADQDDVPFVEPVEPPQDEVVFRASAREEPEAEDTAPETAASENSVDKPDAIPSFLSFARRTAPLAPPTAPESADADAAVTASEADPEPKEPDPVPAAPKPVILDVPDVPDEKDIPAEPALLSSLSTATHVAPEAAALIAQLAGLRDRMTAARKE